VWENTLPSTGTITISSSYPSLVIAMDNNDNIVVATSGDYNRYDANNSSWCGWAKLGSSLSRHIFGGC
jgi:hypothetical protein